MPIQAVTEELLSDFCAFVARSSGRTTTEVERIYRYRWIVDKPNYGFALVADGEVVGALGAIYSKRTVGDEERWFCNIADWFVDEQHRSESIELLFAVLTQPGYSFTALTATREVTTILRGFGFKVVDPYKVAILAAAYATVPGRGRVVADPARVASHIGPGGSGLFDDLSDMRDTRYLVLTGYGEEVHIVLRFVTRKRIRFAVLLYVSDPAALNKCLPALGRWVLWHGRAPFMLAPSTLVTAPPRLSRRVVDPRPPLFLSKEVTKDQVDMLYSELTR